MALSDEIKEQRKLLKGKGPGAYIKYFWDYYRWITLGITLGVIVVIYLIYMFVTAKDQAFGAIFLNAYAEEEMADALREDFAEYAGISLSKDEVSIDMGKYLQPGNQAVDSINITVLATILTHTQSGMLDVIVADADNFVYYLDGDAFGDLRTCFTEEELEAYEGRLYYVDLAEIEAASERAHEALVAGKMPEVETDAYDPQAALEAERLENFKLPDPADMEKPVPVGILMNDAAYIQENGLYSETAVLAGVIGGIKHTEQAKAFIQYLDQEGR